MPGAVSRIAIFAMTAFLALITVAVHECFSPALIVFGFSMLVISIFSWVLSSESEEDDDCTFLFHL
jgi:hypothetical protein